jgi:uncharacterized protein (TIGR03066 family)
MRTVRVALVCCVLLAVTACKESQYKEAIVGKWKPIGGPDIILEFTRDGKISWGGIDGTYRLDGSDNLFITTKTELKGKTRFKTKISIQGNEMTMTDPDGQSGKFKRQ